MSGDSGLARRKSSKPKRIFEKLFHRSPTSYDDHPEKDGIRTAKLSDPNQGQDATLAHRTPSNAPELPPVLESDLPNVHTVARKFIKIRICTWNMAESLPTGDLSDLLGVLPASLTETDDASTMHRSNTGRSLSIETSAKGDNELPSLPLDEVHPYHLVVVGSQECPWAPSTFLGEINSNLRGRENVTWTDLLEDYLCKGGGVKQQPTEMNGNGHAHPPEQRKQRQSSKASQTPIDIKDYARSDDAQPASPVSAVSSSSIPEPMSPRPTTSSLGTTEPHIARQHSFMHRHRKTASVTSLEEHVTDDDVASTKEKAKHHSWNSTDQPRKPIGPYVLVAKERLMGIFISVFVLRSCFSLVKGVSKGRVTAGLLHGRVGNKGGTAVAIKFADFRLLFVSSHLAAHQDASPIRRQNIDKIKEELQIETFSKDEKIKALPDLTDRYDFAFWFGDLNYRLDVSRLHADWLLQSRSYQTALAFDQLNALLKDRNSCFKGFKEGFINFAPTYKYNLISVPRRALVRRSTANKVTTQSQLVLSDDDSFVSPNHGQSNERSDSASVSSRKSIDEFDMKSDGRNRLRGLSLLIPPSHSSDGGSSPQSPAGRGRLTRAATTAILPPTMDDDDEEEDAVDMPFRPPITIATSATSRDTSDSDAYSGRRTPSPLLYSRPVFRSSKSEALMPPRPVLEHRETPYDTSRKQRVQSWTDRILFKTTLMPRPDPPSMPRRIGSGVINSLRLARQSFNSPTHSPRPSHSSMDIAGSLGSVRKVESPTSENGEGAESSPNGLVGNFSLLRRISTGQASSRTNRSSKSNPRRPSTASRTSQSSADVSRTISHPILSFSEARTKARQRQQSTISPSAVPEGDENAEDAEAETPLARISTGQRVRTRVMSGTKKLHLTKTLPTSLSPSSLTQNANSPFAWRSWWLANKLFPSNAKDLEENAIADEEEDADATPVVTYVGPVRGEIQCLRYDSVNDLYKMQALSDHRPVFGVFAAGCEDKQP